MTQMAEFGVAYDVHMYPQWTNDPLQGQDRHVLSVGVYHIPTTNLEPAISITSPVMKFTRSEKCTLEKADQLTLASGGSELA